MIVERSYSSPLSGGKSVVCLLRRSDACTPFKALRVLSSECTLHYNYSIGYPALGQLYISPTVKHQPVLCLMHV